MLRNATLTCLTFLLITAMVTVVSIGCSGGNVTSPTISTGQLNQPASGSNGRVIWTALEFTIDPETLDVEISYLRAGDIHFDVTAFLLPPNCSDCVDINVTNVDTINHIYTADVTLRNPTLQSGYDVRGTIRFLPVDTRELVNPDDYTGVFDEGNPPEINAFRVFAKTEAKRLFADGASHTETYKVKIPNPPNFQINYVVDASWPGNQKEPYEIVDQDIDGHLDELGMMERTVSVIVRDWQNDVESVTIDLTPLGQPGELEFNPGAGNYYFVQITNSAGAAPGDYICQIAAKSAGPILLYDYITITVDEWPDGPPVWIDTIGIQEVQEGDGQVEVFYGIAVDPDMPVHYNVYWSSTSPIDFDTASFVEDFDGSSTIVDGLSNGEIYHLAVRAEDGLGNEDTNMVELTAYMFVNPGEEWSFQTQGVINSSPVFVDLDGDDIKDVVIGSEDAKCYALSGSDGTELWAFQTGNWIDASPAVAFEVSGGENTDIVIGSYDGYVYRIDGETGTEVWKFQTGDKVHGSAAIADLDNDSFMDAIVGSFDGFLYAIDGEDGTEMWKYDTGGSVYSSPALGDITDDGVPDVFIGSRDNSLHAINGATGAIIWFFETGDWVNGSPALYDWDGDNTLDVAFTSLDGFLYVVSGADKSEIFKFQTGSFCWTSPAIGLIDGDLVPDIVFGSDDFKLYAVSGADGTEIWSFTSGDRIWSSAALVDLNGDQVPDAIIGSDDDKLYLIDGSTGQEVWNIPTGNWIDSSPCIGDPDTDGIAEIAVGGFDGKVYMLSSDVPLPTPDMVPWPKFRRNNELTGLFD